MLTFFQILKCNINIMIEIKKGLENSALSLIGIHIIDRYTTTKSRRHVNLNFLSDSDHVNLEMSRIKDSMLAKRVEDLVKERLHEYGFKTKNIVAPTTDRASVMKSLGRLICYIH